MSDEHKRMAAAKAVELVEPGMVLGLGTGSTAAWFVRLLGERIKAERLDIAGVPTSRATEELAKACGVPLIEPGPETVIDLAVDGADEIDTALNLIKGGGGALLREKVIAHAAQRFVVIADASKKVERLGAFALPVEVSDFAQGLTLAALGEAFAECPRARIVPRSLADGQPFRTDGGGLIWDCALGEIDDPADLALALSLIPGVLEHGLFVGMTDLAFIAGPDGGEILTLEGV